MSTVTQAERDLRQEWQTPDDFFIEADGEFVFTVDAAAIKENTTRNLYFGPDHIAPMYRDALQVENWAITGDRTSVWCNPGFNNFMPWMEKAFEQTHYPLCTVVVMALISPDTKWWHWAVTENRADEVRLLRPRVQFVAPDGIKQSSNARNNCLVIFRRKPVEKPCPIWTWNWKT